MYTLNVYVVRWAFASPAKEALFIYIIYVQIYVYVVRCAFRATRNEVRLGSYIRIYYMYTLNVEVPGALFNRRRLRALLNKPTLASTTFNSEL